MRRKMSKIKEIRMINNNFNDISKKNNQTSVSGSTDNSENWVNLVSGIIRLS